MPNAGGRRSAIFENALGESHILDVLSGNILTVTSGQVWMMAAAGLAVAALHSLFSKQLIFSAFDPQTAEAHEIKASRWDLFFFLMLGVIISLAIKLTGTLLVFTFLVAPAVTALLVSKNLGIIYAVSLASALVSAAAGLYVSYVWDLPTGPAITAFMCLLLALAWIFSKFRQ